METSLLQQLETLQNCCDTSLNKQDVDNTIELFDSVANTSGIPEPELFHCIDSLLSLTKLTNHKFQRILHLCMPTTTIATGTLAEILAKVMLWASDEEKVTNAPDRVRAGLQYLIGMLKFNLVEQKQMKIFYKHIYFLLTDPQYQDLAAQLIYYASNQGNLTNWCVVIVQKVMETSKRKPHLKALLALFERLRPDFVSLNTMSTKVEENSFPKLSKTFVRTLEYTKSRLNRVEEQKVAFLDVQQISLASNAYPLYVRHATTFSTMKDFLRFYLYGHYVTFGTNYMSILEHKFNFLLIAVMPDADQIKFKLFMKRHFLETGQIKPFLQNLYKVQDLYPTLSVRNDLKKFLCHTDNWYTYIDEILPFIPKFTVKTYQKFLDIILRPIYHVFVVSHDNVERMRNIVTTLGEFVLQQYKWIANCNSPEERISFLSDADLGIVIDAVKYLTLILLCLEPASFDTTFCVLNFYDLLLQGETLVAIKGSDIVPVPVARLIPITTSAYILEYYAKILEGSFKIIEKRYANGNTYAAFYIGKQIKELYALLTESSIALGSPNVYIKSASYEKLQGLQRKSAFKLTYNVAFWPYTRFDQMGKWLTKPVVDKTRLKDACPTLIRLLTDVKLSEKKRS